MGCFHGRKKCAEDGTCCKRTFVCGFFVIFLLAWTMLKLHTFHSLSQPSTFLILKQNLNGVTFVTVYCIFVGFLCDMLYRIWVRELLKHVCDKFSGDNYVESSSWELCQKYVPLLSKISFKSSFFLKSVVHISAMVLSWWCDAPPVSPCLIAQYLINQSYYCRGNHVSVVDWIKPNLNAVLNIIARNHINAAVWQNMYINLC